MPTATGELTTAEVAQIAALIQAQAQLRDQLTAIGVAAVTAPLAAFSAWFSAAATTAAIEQMLAVILPAQLRMARTTDAYIAAVLTIMTGRRVPAAGAVDVRRLRRKLSEELLQQLADNLPDDYDYEPSQDEHAHPVQLGDDAATAAVDAVDPADVYGRIFDGARFRIVARGYSQEQVLRWAINRAAAVVMTDVMLADRAQSRETMRARGIRGYRRVLRPYAGKGGPVCGLCIVASDRIYSVANLMPIHDRCRCETLPVTATADPGRRLNEFDLRRLYRAAGGTGGRGLKEVRVGIREHGELGPVLVEARHRRRGPREVAAATAPDPNVTRRAQLASYERYLPQLKARAAAGEDVGRAITWQENKIAQLRRQLGEAA